jgi:hypothetical protein
MVGALLPWGGLREIKWKNDNFCSSCLSSSHDIYHWEMLLEVALEECEWPENRPFWEFWIEIGGHWGKVCPSLVFGLKFVNFFD